MTPQEELKKILDERPVNSVSHVFKELLRNHINKPENITLKKEELIAGIGLSEGFIDALLCQQIPLNEDIVKKLAKFFPETTVEFWLELEKKFVDGPKSLTQGVKNFNINKKPEHPGAIARLLLRTEGYNLVDTIEFNENKIKVMQRGIGGECTVARFESSFISESKESRCDYCIAYELVKLLPHTTMEFWLNKQDDYDAWHAWHKQNDFPVLKETDNLKEVQDFYHKHRNGVAKNCTIKGYKELLKND